MAKRYKLAAMRGDGIGPEIVPATIELLDAAAAQAGVSFDWEPLPMGWEAIEAHGDPMPDEIKAALRGCQGWLAGPHDSASYPEDWRQQRRPPPTAELRHDFDLYANVRPAKNLPGVPAMVSGVDLVIYRENTEGTYPDRSMFAGHGEFMPTPDLAMVIGVYKRESVRRIVEAAFQAARQRRGHLTVVHKANVLSMTTGMYIVEAERLAPQYPDVTVDKEHVDAMAAHLVRRPGSFDVVVTDNLFGDILSDLACEVVGSIGIGPGLNAGDEHAMAQAVHGSAPDIAGKDSANPIGLMVSGCMLLRWLGARFDDEAVAAAADRAEAAIAGTLAAGTATRDLGGSAGTRAFTEATLATLEAS